MTYSYRRLPHWQPTGRDIFLTWRLHGSLPARFRRPHKGEASGRDFVVCDRILDDALTGPLWLKEERIAKAVLVTMQEAQHAKLFRLHAYVLMANHVHVLIEPCALLPEITRRIKGATARQANLLLGLTGNSFWQDESFDHWVRSPAELQKIRTYIEQNPVKAGLVVRAEEWPWSSASHPSDGQ